MIHLLIVIPNKDHDDVRGSIYKVREDLKRIMTDMNESSVRITLLIERNDPDSNSLAGYMLDEVSRGGISSRFQHHQLYFNSMNWKDYTRALKNHLVIHKNEHLLLALYTCENNKMVIATDVAVVSAYNPYCKDPVKESIVIDRQDGDSAAYADVFMCFWDAFKHNVNTLSITDGNLDPNDFIPLRAFEDPKSGFDKYHNSITENNVVDGAYKVVDDDGNTVQAYNLKNIKPISIDTPYDEKISEESTDSSDLNVVKLEL